MDELPVSACWTLPDHVERAARRWPDAELLVFGAERVSFAQFDERTRAFARGLIALGVGPGERVGIFMRNLPDMLDRDLRRDAGRRGAGADQRSLQGA